MATSNWGLFVARSIVHGHGGVLRIESEEGKGTTARIVLPLERAFEKEAPDSVQETATH